MAITQLDGFGQALLCLEIRLPIQFGCLDETQTIWLGCGQQQGVGGHELIVVQPNDIAHLYLRPLGLHQLAIAQRFRLAIVYLRVRNMTLLKGKYRLAIKKLQRSILYSQYHHTHP